MIAWAEEAKAERERKLHRLRSEQAAIVWCDSCCYEGPAMIDEIGVRFCPKCDDADRLVVLESASVYLDLARKTRKAGRWVA